MKMKLIKKCSCKKKCSWCDRTVKDGEYEHVDFKHVICLDCQEHFIREAEQDEQPWPD